MEGGNDNPESGAVGGASDTNANLGDHSSNNNNTDDVKGCASSPGTAAATEASTEASTGTAVASLAIAGLVAAAKAAAAKAKASRDDGESSSGSSKDSSKGSSNGSGKDNNDTPANLVHPRANDVLCGRGKLRQLHNGNQLYLSFICSCKQEYEDAGKGFKIHVVHKVVDYITKTLNGRFLIAHDISRNLWVPVPRAKAMSKTSQAFRDLPKVRLNNICTSNSAVSKGITSYTANTTTANTDTMRPDTAVSSTNKPPPAKRPAMTASGIPLQQAMRRGSAVKKRRFLPTQNSASRLLSSKSQLTAPAVTPPITRDNTAATILAAAASSLASMKHPSSSEQRVVRIENIPTHEIGKRPPKEGGSMSDTETEDSLPYLAPRSTIRVSS